MNLVQRSVRFVVLSVSFIFPFLQVANAESCGKAQIVAEGECSALLVQFDISSCEAISKKQIAEVACSGASAVATVKTASSVYTAKLQKGSDGWKVDGPVSRQSGKSAAKEKAAVPVVKAKAVVAPVAVAIAPSPVPSPSPSPTPAAPAPSTTIDSAELPQGAQKPEGNLFERNFTTSATLFLASNYIFRGITQTRQGPAIQGSFDITHGSGLGVGGFISNVSFDAPLDKTRTEADLYALYNAAFGDWSFGVMALWYNYVETPEINAMEYSGFVKYKWFKVDVAHQPKFSGTDSKDTYARFGASVPVTAKNTLNASIGRSWFSDESLAGTPAYDDYKVSVSHAVAEFTTEFVWTDTDRKDLNDQRLKDQALTVILSRTF